MEDIVTFYADKNYPIKEDKNGNAGEKGSTAGIMP